MTKRGIEIWEKNTCRSISIFQQKLHLFYWYIKTHYLLLALVTPRVIMIISYGSKNTEKIFMGERVGKIPLEIQQIGRRKLRMLNNSTTIEDLNIPPSNRLEKLKGKNKGFYSIRINNQWRITFKWEKNNAIQVDIIDYHK